jgi:protein tyrosine phosphatase (PTP) superfamily phosphohydrolase (DUF442 family)
MTRKRRGGNRRLIFIIVGVIAVAAGWRAWHKVIRYELFPRNFGVVEEGQIYRSGRLTPRMLREVCEDRNIRTIIDLTGDDGEPEQIREQEEADRLGVQRVAYDLHGDGTGDPADYAEVLRIMADPDRQPVLVHCATGAQRTSAAVVLYRHLIQGRPLEEVYPESFEYKHKPDEWILLAYIAEHREEIRAALEESDTPADDRAPAEADERSSDDEPPDEPAGESSGTPPSRERDPT